MEFPGNSREFSGNQGNSREFPGILGNSQEFPGNQGNSREIPCKHTKKHAKLHAIFFFGNWKTEKSSHVYFVSKLKIRSGRPSKSYFFLLFHSFVGHDFYIFLRYSEGFITFKKFWHHNYFFLTSMVHWKSLEANIGAPETFY